MPGWASVTHPIKEVILLRPTAEELATAKELGIDSTGMNGPAIREAIDRARRSRQLPSIRENTRYESLVRTADILGVPIKPGEGVESAMRHVEEYITTVFAKRGIVQSARVCFTADYGQHMGKEAIIHGLKMWWFEFQLMMSVYLDGQVRSIAAYHVALHTQVL